MGERLKEAAPGNKTQGGGGKRGAVSASGLSEALKKLRCGLAFPVLAPYMPRMLPTGVLYRMGRSR